MSEDSELKKAIIAEREAEMALQACKRRVNELAGLVSDKKQRKKKASRPESFLKACGL